MLAAVVDAGDSVFWGLRLSADDAVCPHGGGRGGSGARFPSDSPRPPPPRRRPPLVRRARRRAPHPAVRGLRAPPAGRAPDAPLERPRRPGGPARRRSPRDAPGPRPGRPVRIRGRGHSGALPRWRRPGRRGCGDAAAGDGGT